MKKEITEEVVYEDSSYVEEDIYEDEEEETSGSFETYEEEQNEQDDILFINDNITREKNNYSASAVMEILFQLKGFDESQNAIARRLNIQNGGIADYELVVSTLNDILQNHGYGKTFAGVYLEPEQIDALNEEYFQESIERNLSQGYPVIVCINGKDKRGNPCAAEAFQGGLKCSVRGVVADVELRPHIRNTDIGVGVKALRELGSLVKHVACVLRVGVIHVSRP